MPNALNLNQDWREPGQTYTCATCCGECEIGANSEEGPEKCPDCAGTGIERHDKKRLVEMIFEWVKKHLDLNVGDYAKDRRDTLASLAVHAKENIPILQIARDAERLAEECPRTKDEPLGQWLGQIIQENYSPPV